jgi:histone H3/H4
MKNSLPTTAKVSKEAKECVQECVSEFISFIVSLCAIHAPPPCLRLFRRLSLRPPFHVLPSHLPRRFSRAHWLAALHRCSHQTSEAAEKCLHEKRKTINGEDILTSMRALGFDNYEGVLKVYLAKYREHQITQARLRQSQPQLVLDEEDGLKRGAEDEDGDARRKKPRGKKRDD